MENKTGKRSHGRKRPKPVLAKAKATMQSLIYQELRRSLMAGVFMPGAKVTLRSVTAQIGTSVMPAVLPMKS
jgi:DNA-binding GntR family transcriptional regulator